MIVTDEQYSTATVGLIGQSNLVSSCTQSSPITCTIFISSTSASADLFGWIQSVMMVSSETFKQVVSALRLDLPPSSIDDRMLHSGLSCVT